MTWKEPIFHWRALGPSAWQCNVEGVGRLIARRTRPYAHEFTCLINGNDYLCVHRTMDKAIKHCQQLAVMILGMDVHRLCPVCKAKVKGGEDAIKAHKCGGAT